MKCIKESNSGIKWIINKQKFLVIFHHWYFVCIYLYNFLLHNVLFIHSTLITLSLHIFLLDDIFTQYICRADHFFEHVLAYSCRYEAVWRHYRTQTVSDLVALHTFYASITFLFPAPRRRDAANQEAALQAEEMGGEKAQESIQELFLPASSVGKQQER